MAPLGLLSRGEQAQIVEIKGQQGCSPGSTTGIGRREDREGLAQAGYQGTIHTPFGLCFHSLRTALYAVRNSRCCDVA